MISAPNSHRVLSEDECEHWTLQVLLLKQYWIKRHQQVPFYSLGLASYLDLFGSPQGLSDLGYKPETISYHNQVLLGHFVELYQRIVDFLSDLFQLSACFNPEHLSLPGFHIYQSSPFFAENVGHIHRDLQHKWLFGANSDSNDVLTFTLPLSIPDESGLNFYDPGSSEPDEFFPYKEGEILLHSGLRTHQAVINCCADLEQRITLQGHGFRHKNKLILYW